MLSRLQSALDIGRNWLPPFRKRRSVYQQWAPSNSTDLRVLTAATTKSDSTIIKSEIDVDSEYRRPNVLDSTAHFFENLGKTRVQKIFGDRFTGWRFGALHFGVWAVVVFLINFITTIWGSISRRSGVLLEGDCNRVEFLNTALHVLINVLSTILLSGSNYCMQCLSAPTRNEVDKAHADGKWLDIGIPSIRNVKHLGRKRTILWVVLAFTSLPLHLFYNSAVFGSLSSNDYFAFSVSQSFLDDDTCSNCSNSVNKSMAVYETYTKYMYSNYWRSYDAQDVPRLLQDLHRSYKVGSLEKLQPQECLNRYATGIISDWHHVLLVASDDNFPTAEENRFISGSHAFWAAPFYANAARTAEDSANAYSWICSGLESNGVCSNNVDQVRKNISDWRTGHYCVGTIGYDGLCDDARKFPVQYCLSAPAQPHCRLQFDKTIAVIVTVLNAVKAALMFYIAFCVRDEPLITMGDAVASFLTRADSTTKNMCLLSIRDVRNKGVEVGARQWVNVQPKWKNVVSKKRRATTLALFLAALALVSFLLGLGITSLPSDSPRSLAFLASLGYGTVDPRTAITGLKNDLVSNAIIANSPQVILSMLYFSYNALFTSFLLSHEWISYAHKKKGLRVSADPVGKQRTDYFLQLPYRFGVPLMALSGTLHWLVSQSIFLVSIDFYDVFGNPSSTYIDGFDNMKTCGYSPIAIISVIVLGSLMVIAIVAFGFLPFKQGMTLAGNCSMAISAACHLDKRVDEDGEVVAMKKVQWGVVGTSEDGIGHCGFSTGRVTAPVEGETYAGTPR